MYDAGKVILGVAVFLALIAFPIWYNVAIGDPGYSPELEKAAKGENCVRDAEYMTGNHMDVLNTWRDEVVRGDDRFFEHEGHRYEKSLTNTCLDCHVNKDQFCDKCHDYLSVTPYCWDCHIVPKEIN